MTDIQTKNDVELDDPYLLEGFPGVGLVGKIAVDHVVEKFGMDEYAACDCEGLPDVAVFDEGKSGIKAPVRILVDEETDLLALQSEAPVSPQKTACFADCFTKWLGEIDATPVYLSGLPSKKEEGESPDMYGVSVAGMEERLRELGIQPPSQNGVVSGPTGSLLNKARKTETDAAGLIVESDPQFPDPGASRVLIEEGISPITGVDIDTQELVEHAEEIMEKKKQLAEQMSEAGEESTSAAPVGMYQ
ncbi:MAG: PAC2 family protein [Halobacteria archaeon]|nr:PAC2 family protein [Halobacteria archaeon]